MAAVIPLPTEPWGATQDDWTHFTLFLGLTPDLLPVVSNPKAIKSPDSKLQGPGKTPSRYNGDRQMVGITKWTEKVSTDAEVARWAKEPDYGICLQTRTVRALDVDVSDITEAAAIQEFIDQRLGLSLPIRIRQNSPKFLHGFTMPGDFTKRRIKTQHGIVEFLATGQQFVACGTHTSGVRYEWVGGLPDEFPTLDVAEFEALWLALEESFGIEPSVETRKGTAPLVKRTAGDAADDLIDYLHEHWMVKGEDRSGRVDIRCPFEDGHSTESGDSATSYFPAGVGGFEQGHFKCQHASCAHRTDADFLDAIGYIAADFDVVEPPKATTTTPDGAEVEIEHFEIPKLLHQNRKKSGRIEANRHTVTLAMRMPQISGMRIGLDRFRDEVMIAPPGADEWRPFRDKDYHAVALTLEAGPSGFEHIPKEILRDAVGYIAEQNAFDSAQLWLGSRKWDGAPRIDTFLTTYFCIADTPYVRAVSRYLWSALAGRVMDPGCQADMVPVLLGPQGARKTTAVAAISPAPDFFGELDLGLSDDNLARLLRGKLVVELGELKGIGAKANEHLKAFLSRRHEEWTPKFKEFNTKFPRRCLLIATTNDEEHLPPDSTGYRRWLPVRVPDGVVCNAEAIMRDRDQLWAEAACLWSVEGVRWDDAERLARDEHKHYARSDAWLDSIDAWLHGSEMGEEAPAKRPYIATNDIITGALSIPISAINQSTERRVNDIMRVLGWEKGVRAERKVWVRKGG